MLKRDLLICRNCKKNYSKHFVFHYVTEKFVLLGTTSYDERKVYWCTSKAISRGSILDKSYFEPMNNLELLSYAGKNTK